MHQTEAIETDLCASCGTEIATTDRTYSFSDDSMICFECAVSRGGAYDETHDRWTEAPEVTDLMEAEAREGEP